MQCLHLDTCLHKCKKHFEKWGAQTQLVSFDIGIVRGAHIRKRGIRCVCVSLLTATAAINKQVFDFKNNVRLELWLF